MFVQSTLSSFLRRSLPDSFSTMLIFVHMSSSFSPRNTGCHTCAASSMRSDLRRFGWKRRQLGGRPERSSRQWRQMRREPSDSLPLSFWTNRQNLRAIGLNAALRQPDLGHEAKRKESSLTLSNEKQTVGNPLLQPLRLHICTLDEPTR